MSIVTLAQACIWLVPRMYLAWRGFARHSTLCTPHSALECYLPGGYGACPARVPGVSHGFPGLP
jgi:hypothetical protein